MTANWLTSGTGGSLSWFRRGARDAGEQDDDLPETLVELQQLASRDQWVLEGTYYADTGEAPADVAVFGNTEQAAEASKILVGKGSDAGAVKRMWQGLTPADMGVFVKDAGEGLERLRARARVLRDVEAQLPNSEHH